jgi:hypothetical protein
MAVLIEFVRLLEGEAQLALAIEGPDEGGSFGVLSGGVSVGALQVINPSLVREEIGLAAAGLLAQSPCGLREIGSAMTLSVNELPASASPDMLAETAAVTSGERGKPARQAHDMAGVSRTNTPTSAAAAMKAWRAASAPSSSASASWQASRAAM